MSTFPVRISNAGRLSRNFARASTEVDRAMTDSLDELGDIAEMVYAAHALRKTGRLARGIVARRQGGGVLVTATAKNPVSGYDYVAVSRFGHKGKIVPRADRGAASVIATGGSRATGRKAALRFSLGGKVLYRASTKGFHPSSDWSDRALPQVEAQAKLVAARLGRKIEALI